MNPGEQKPVYFRSKLSWLVLALAIGVGLALLGNSILAKASAEAGFAHEPQPTPELSEVEQSPSPEALLQLQVQKAAPDIAPPPGPVSDTFGNDMHYGPRGSEWWDITGGTPITFGLSGDRFKAVDLGFIFPFYENKYSRLYVYAEGIVAFDNVTLFQDSIPTDYSPNNYIAPFWAPILDVGYANAGRLYTAIQGSAPDRTFIAEWFNVTPLGSANTLTFEVVLHENGNIDFLYQTVNYNGEFASVGIEDSDGVDGLQYMFHEPGAVTADLKVNFTRPPGAGDAYRAKVLPTYRGKLMDNWQAAYQLTVRNASMTKTDTFDLECTNNGTWDVSFYEADGWTLLRDTNGNSKKDTGGMAPSASKTIIVLVKAPKTEPATTYKDLVIYAESASSGGVVKAKATLRAAVPVNFATAFYDVGTSKALTDLIWKNNDYMPLLIDAFDGGNLAFARKPDKGYVYAWDNAQKPEEGNNKYKEIRFLILSQFGTPTTVVTDIDDHANPYENIKDERVAVAVAPNGKIGFTWLRTEATNNENVFFTVRDAAGNPVGTLQSVTGFSSSGTCSSPSIAATTDNKFVVVWLNDQVVDYKEIWYRVFDSAGNPITVKTRLAYGASVDFTSPSITSLSGGKAFLSYRKDAGGVATVKYMIYDGSGWSSEYSITVAEGYSPQAVQFINGNVLLAWSDRDFKGISYVVFNPSSPGTPTITTLQAPNNRSLGNISLTVDPGGRGVLSWMDVTHFNYLYYAVVNSSGNILTSPMTYMGEGVNSKLVSSYVGLGIASYDGAFRNQLPFLRK